MYRWQTQPQPLIPSVQLANCDTNDVYRRRRQVTKPSRAIKSGRLKVSLETHSQKETVRNRVGMPMMKAAHSKVAKSSLQCMQLIMVFFAHGRAEEA